MIRATRLTDRRRTIAAGALITVAVVLGCCATLSSFTIARAEAPPSLQQIHFAEQTSDLFLATLFGALLQEFGETTPANVEQGKKSISLVFNDANQDMRLVGTFQPLRANDVPQDTFERTALEQALNGQNFTDVQKADGKWYYRRSVALSNFHPACAMCHTNFGPVNNTQFVGALMLRVPVSDRTQD